MAVQSAFPSAMCVSARCSASLFLLISGLVKGSSAECLSDEHDSSTSPSCGRAHFTPTLSTEFCPTLWKSQEPLIHPSRLRSRGVWERANKGWGERVALEGLREAGGEGDAPTLTSIAFTKRVTFWDTSGHACVLLCEHNISSCRNSMSRECSIPMR